MMGLDRPIILSAYRASEILQPLNVELREIFGLHRLIGRAADLDHDPLVDHQLQIASAVDGHPLAGDAADLASAAHHGCAREEPRHAADQLAVSNDSNLD